MQNSLRLIREAIASWIAPPQPEPTALVYVPTVANKGKFLQINEPGRPRNYRFVCACGSGAYNYNGKSIHETYKCACCKGEFNLVLALADTLEVPHRELERRLEDLDIVPYVPRAPQRRHVAVGDDFDGVVNYESSDIRGLF
jgi:hypothetical protein